MVNRNEEVEEEKYNRPCTDAILAFDTETEEFRLLPHPGDSSCYYRPQEHENMYLLLGTRDHLYLCHVTWGEVINVWVLEDYAGWAWDRRYKVSLDWDVKCFPFTADYSGIYNPKDVRVLGIHNGELMIDWVSRGPFSYHLVKNTVSQVSIALKGMHSPIPFATAYYKSLVRLE
ncbi:hypothetical protein LguiA_002091 [Lonicera macranthoides]